MPQQAWLGAAGIRTLRTGLGCVVVLVAEGMPSTAMLVAVLP
jgi:hypothetical protein